MDLKFELSQRQVIMLVYSYLPGPTIRFQLLNHRFYETVLPQWVGFVALLDFRIRVLPRPKHSAHNTYSFPGEKYLQGLTSLEKSEISVTGIRYCNS